MMLRIQKSCNGCSTVIQVCGRLSAVNRQELSNLVESSTGSIILDLGELTLIDLESVQLLAKYQAEGVQLMHCPLYISEWISRENNNVSRAETSL